MTPPDLTIPPLISGGIMLTYRCSHTCKHCIYRCSTRHDDHFMSEAMIDRTFAALSEEHSLFGVHIAGGEATLNWDRLLYAVRSAVRHGVALDYLETNASWCDDEATALAAFRRLRHAGLDGVLISASLFHNEFTPLRKTEAAIRAARQVFGRGGTLVWTTEVFQRMQRALDPHKTHPLSRSCELLGIEHDQGELYRLHGYLRPGGRAGEKLTAGLPRRQPFEFEGDACRDTLHSTQHFHIDPFGNLFTGHCPGVSIATVENLHPVVPREQAPVLDGLKRGGPYAVWEEIGQAAGFSPDPKGYVSKCHFCLELCKHLFATGRFQELRPGAFYDATSQA